MQEPTGHRSPRVRGHAGTIDTSGTRRFVPDEIRARWQTSGLLSTMHATRDTLVLWTKKRCPFFNDPFFTFETSTVRLGDTEYATMIRVHRPEM